MTTAAVKGRSHEAVREVKPGRSARLITCQLPGAGTCQNITHTTCSVLPHKMNGPLCSPTYLLKINARCRALPYLVMNRLYGSYFSCCQYCAIGYKQL